MLNHVHFSILPSHTHQLLAHPRRYRTEPKIMTHWRKRSPSLTPIASSSTESWSESAVSAYVLLAPVPLALTSKPPQLELAGASNKVPDGTDAFQAPERMLTALQGYHAPTSRTWGGVGDVDWSLVQSREWSENWHARLVLLCGCGWSSAVLYEP